MEVKQNRILRLVGGSDKQFIIPVYQRAYSWEKKNCEQLLDDLREVDEHDRQSHFFGSIVFVGKHDGQRDNFIIIDGQQRITTVSLLLLAIRKYLLEHPDLEIKAIDPQKIMDDYLIDKYADDTNKVKLKLIQGDNEAYDALVEDKKPIKDTRITENYKCFYDEIEKMPPQELEGIYKAISKLNIVGISLEPDRGDDPQLIFESLNSTGMDLETSDKIRNYVLMNMDYEEQEIFYRKYWKTLEQIVGNSELNKFIRYYLAIRRRHLFNEKKLYYEFKYYCEDSDLTLADILQDMIEYGEYYHEIMMPKKDRSSYTETLKRINQLEVKTCVPLMMDLFKARSQGYLSDEELNKALEIIENYIVRREICNLPTNVFNRLFVQIGAEIEKDIQDDHISYYDAFCKEMLSRTGKSRFPNDHEFKEHFELYDLYDTKPAMRKYILERLENFGNKEIVDVERQVDEKRLTIEHIMPQKLTEEWKRQLGENWELIHSKYLNTPGNLTLTGYNSDYSNSSFEKKKMMPEKGFQASKLTLNDDIKTCDTWGETQIQERANILYQKAEKIWWMPSLKEADSDEEAQWISWDKDVNLAYKQVIEIDVKGTLIKTKNMSDAYRKVHKMLFDIDPDTYHHSGFSWVGRTEKEVRKAYKLAESLYIEMNKSNQDKMNVIKAVCEKMKLAPEDVRLLITDKKTEH